MTTHCIHSITNFMKVLLLPWLFGVVSTRHGFVHESSPGRMIILLVPLAWLYRASGLNLTYDLCLLILDVTDGLMI